MLCVISLCLSDHNCISPRSSVRPRLELRLKPRRPKVPVRTSGNNICITFDLVPEGLRLVNLVRLPDTQSIGKLDRKRRESPRLPETSPDNTV